MTRIKRSARRVFCVAIGLLLLVFPFIGRSSGTASAASSAVPVQGLPNVIGQWSPTMDLGTYAPGVQRCAIHTTLLPSGKVLFWGRDKQPNGSGWLDVQNGPWQTFIWDPAGGTSTTTITHFNSNLFCSGHSMLPDGKLLVAGGHLQQDGHGDSSISLFDSTPPGNWSPGPAMNAGRWYPSTCSLGNGETLILEGTTSTGGENTTPQVYQTNGTLRNLNATGVGNFDVFYPRTLLAPNGQVFIAGADQVTWFLQTSGAGSLTQGPSSNFAGHRDYGSAAMYDDGKVMIVGGSDPAVATAETINLTMNNTARGKTPVWQNTNSMIYARRQLNLTILPDGKLLATGGTTTGCDLNSAVKPAEMWNPTTGSWSVMASMTQARTYHSTAILLPDGRVLVGGSGGYGPNSDPSQDNTKLEIYSPPYLFDANQNPAVRPTISTVPTSLNHGQQFFVGTPDAASISKVTLVRLSSVTHAFNENQRINFLSFSQTAGGLTVTAPGSGNICPPGYYMLFLVNGNGVPSIASFIQMTVPSSPLNAIDDQRYFTSQQYNDILLRAADSGGLAFWTNQINQCGTNATCIASQRVAVSRAFWDSAEFQNPLKANNDPLFSPTPPNGLEFNAGPFISWCYLIYMARTADSGGLSFWTNNLNNCIASNPGNSSQCYNNTINAFITSSEYRNRFYKP